MFRLKKIFISFSIAYFAVETSFAQNAWNTETMQKANTAKNVSYLTIEEKEVIFYTNLARLEPKLFAETYVKKYVDSTDEHGSYTKSLLKELSGMKPVEMLLPDEQLFKIAKEHAISFGKSGKTGHGNFKKRFTKVMNACNCKVGENCDYGYDQPLDIVMHLLIDDGIKDLAHRKNSLDPTFRKVGVSIQKHQRYEWNCVIDFSGAGQ